MKLSDVEYVVTEQFRVSNAVPYLLMGAPGVGKSAISRKIIGNLGIKPERTVEFNASLRDPIDVMGLPKMDGEKARWLPPSEFYRIRDDGTDEPCALILEELTDASMAMMNVLCRVVYDRMAGELPLHPKLYIIASGNRTEDKSGANRLSTKLANRFRIHGIEVSLDDFCVWALEHGVSTKLVQFLRFRPNLLCNFDANRTVNPTPRAWERVSRIPTTLKDSMLFAEVSGDVGEGAAAEYVGFLRLYDTLPNIDEAVLHPDKVKVPDKPEVCFALIGALVERVNKDNFDRLYTLFERFPIDFTVMAISDSIRKAPEVRNTRAFVQFATKNSSVLF